MATGWQRLGRSMPTGWWLEIALARDPWLGAVTGVFGTHGSTQTISQTAQQPKGYTHVLSTGQWLRIWIFEKNVATCQVQNWVQNCPNAKNEIYCFLLSRKDCIQPVSWSDRHPSVCQAHQPLSDHATVHVVHALRPTLLTLLWLTCSTSYF